MKLELVMIQFLKHWIVLVLPLTVVLVRLGLFKFAGELDDLYRNLFAIPQDLIFIAVSFILAGLSRTIPAFAMRYPSDRDADIGGVIHLLILLAIAWALCKTNKLATTLHRNFRVSWKQVNRFKSRASNFSWRTVPPEISGRLLWGIAYMAIIGIIVATELLISCFAVAESLQRIQP
jgi:hypothetical protein